MGDIDDRFRGCLLGLAVGDALGTTVEFSPRGTFPLVTDIVGGGPFDLAPGEWTDDTSMALCLATSLVECGRFDLRDQIERYCRWHEEGYLSSNGRCFDIGNTVRRALHNYRATGNSSAGSNAPSSAGNGCIMRLAPVPMFFFPDEQAAIEYSGKSCVTTHAATECIEAARLLGAVLLRILAGATKKEAVGGAATLMFTSSKLQLIARGEYLQKAESGIRGSGYVVECLEAALWSFARAESFSEAVLTAANLGDDADTTAAVCGQMAGAFYGESGIPAQWLERIALRAEIGILADRLRRKAR